MMIKELILKYRSVILIFLLVVILFSIRSISGDHFRQGAEKNAIPALMGSNILEYSADNLSITDALYIYLDKTENIPVRIDMEVLSISKESLLSKESLNLMKWSKGRVILISEDPTLLARAWMLLAQKGVRNLYIMGIDLDNEYFKYEFRPDTVKVSR